MKALSIRQPWAWLIVNGYKDVENRTWPLPRTFELPQRIYIHAGLKQDYDAYEGDPTYRRLRWDIRNLIRPNGAWDWNTGSTPSLGAIVGEATLFGWLSDEEPKAQKYPWFKGPYGFFLRDAVAYETPIPYKGRLGFFEVQL